MTKIKLTCLGALCALAIGCGGTDINDPDFVYGQGMPGVTKTEGGEVLMEKIFISPALAGDPAGPAAQFNAFHAFHYFGTFAGAQRVPAPGECFEIIHPTTFPVHDIGEGAEYDDWGPSISLSGPGIAGSVTIDKVVAPAEGLIDGRPSPVRNHKEGNFIYGGPSWQMANFQNVELQEGLYTLDINNGEPLTFNFPPAYTFPLNIGSEDIQLPTTTDGLDVTFQAIPNPNTPHGRAHTFPFIAFAAFPGAGDRGPMPLFLCQPPLTEDGLILIPQEVIDSIPDAGIIQAGRLTHYMDVLNDRRLDLFAIYCALSTYQKEGAAQ